MTKDEVKEIFGVKDKTRTLAQNSALHLYFTMLADELNSAGLDMKKVLKPEVDIPWTLESIKNHLWRPIQKIMFNKKSTTELTKSEVTEVWEVLNRSLSSKHGIGVPFPSEEQLSNPNNNGN